MRFKNQLLLGLVSLLKKRKPTQKSSAIRKFLIVSTTALGDTLWATPSLHSLKKSFPNIKISVLTSPIGFMVLKENPDVDKFFIYRHFLSLFTLFFTLRKENFDSILFFHASQRVILPLCATLGASELIGNQGSFKGLERLLSLSIPQKFSHEIERRLELVMAAGAEVHSRELNMPLSETDRASAGEWLSLRGLDNHRLIGIHAGASNPFKKWPLESFISVANSLSKEGYTIIFTGNANELETLKSLKINMPEVILTLPELSLAVLAGLIQRFSLYICNDTGPMHISFAVKTPTLCLFTPTDSRLCGPLSVPFTKIIQKEKTCIPCIGKKCHSPVCLMQISVDEVLEEARKLLNPIAGFIPAKEILPKTP